MKRKIIICIATLAVILIVFFITNSFLQSRSEEEISSLPISYEEEAEESDEETSEQITQIIENQGLEADESIYELTTEYDGREVVTVKSSIKYNVALAGMLKKSIPEFSEINDLLTRCSYSYWNLDRRII